MTLPPGSVWDNRVAPLPLAGFTDWVSMFGFVVHFFALPLLPLVFPDGRFASRYERILGQAVITLAGAATIARFLVPERADVDAAVRNPIQIDGLYSLNYVTLVCLFLCLGVATPLAVVAAVLRYRLRDAEFALSRSIVLVAVVGVAAVGDGRSIRSWPVLGPVLPWWSSVSSVPLWFEPACNDSSTIGGFPTCGVRGHWRRRSRPRSHCRRNHAPR